MAKQNTTDITPAMQVRSRIFKQKWLAGDMTEEEYERSQLFNELFHLAIAQGCPEADLIAEFRNSTHDQLLKKYHCFLNADFVLMDKLPSQRGQALVAIINNKTDWQIVQERLWYRVPVETAPRRWPPRWLAFYQTKVFRDEAFAVHYYGEVREIRRVRRTELFPTEFPNAKSNREYYQILLKSLEQLPRPIVSYRMRRIVFIPTTYYKLQTADEINDLYDDSPLEEALWYEMKRLKLLAERQFHLKAAGASYCLDFALFCERGKLNIETDGDRWHADPARIPEDNRRNNALASEGWQVLRFNTHQIKEEMEQYCVPQIAETVNQLGGPEALTDAPRQYYPTEEGIVQQMTLFDGKTAYSTESETEED